MNTMKSIVKTCLEQHEGGEIFFDNLDEMIRNDDSLIKMMIEKIQKEISPSFIVVSGNFGIVFLNYCMKNMPMDFTSSVIVVPGGLRNGVPVGNIPIKFSNQKGIFIDDSYYLGRTQQAIAKELKKIGSEIYKTYVFYDGSKEKKDDVVSFYRYYDHV